MSVKHVHCINISTNSPFCRTLFQQFMKDDWWLSGLPHSLHSTRLASNSLKTEINGCLRGLGPDCMMDGREAPSSSFESPPTHRKMVRDCALCCRMIFSTDICHAVHSAACWVSEGNKQHWWFPLVAKTWPVCIPKDTSHHLTGCRHCFWLLFLGWCCDAIPCSVIVFLDHSDGTNFYYPSTCCKESLPLTAYCSSNCEETFCTEVCAPPLARQEPSVHMLSGIKLAAISQTTWCPIPISAAISLSQVDFLWWAHPILFCFCQQGQFAGKHYGTQWRYLCSLL